VYRKKKKVLIRQTSVLSDYVTMEPASNLASLQLNDSAAKWKRDLETYLIDSTQVDLDENLGEG
jgi:hypothetical protein